ncbi:MAG TPA: class I SAM-dependent methyltransferase [Gammaproteobacteria bacterium]|nr:class I SAM-dependent methyltransferase [Gammaproteobacteria bacterium]
MKCCHRRDTCRLCGGRLLTRVISLTPTPPANAFVPESEKDREQSCFPLDVFFCETCFHVQLLDVVDPKVLFENYIYVSGTSPVFVNHFRQYADSIIRHAGLSRPGLVVDVGSNDGTLLRFFKDAGHAVLGIDPARNIAEAATASGIETLPAFFDSKLASELRSKRGPAEIICANNVYAHVDDLREFTTGVKNLLAPHGLFVFEVSYLVDVVAKVLFDTIYHEHLSYHSVMPLVRFFDSMNMELIEAVRIDSHGGSLRGIAQLKGATRSVGKSVTEAIQHERDVRLDESKTFVQMAGKINLLKSELMSLLTRLRREGKRIAGFGAPAKVTTLMYHFGLDAKIIDFIVDDSPMKQGLYTPGLHIPVLSPQALYERRPDYALILAWNFADSIMKKHETFLRSGGHFIIPLPEIKVV